MALLAVHTNHGLPVVGTGPGDPGAAFAAAGEGSAPGSPLAFHRSLPGYAVTPLVEVTGLAASLGVGGVLVKDESQRLGLPSYKVLGASWATYREVVEVFGLEEDALPIDVLRRVRGLTLVAATDGNHGRAVARIAALAGWTARVYVPAGTARARIAGIAGEGATVVVVDGSYDDAVRRAAEDADHPGECSLVVSDTAWPGYERVPRRVVEGYSAVFAEVDEQLRSASLPAPTVVVVQMGVGALAAAAVLHYRTTSPDAGGGDPARRVEPTRLLGVEPADAACVLASVRAGRLTEVPGPHRSIMAGLNCGLPSPVALPLLAAGMDAFVAVDDDEARRAMRLLASAGVESGESGAAGLAGLAALVRSPQAAARDAVRALGLDAGARVLLISTEGATDPSGYADVVGP